MLNFRDFDLFEMNYPNDTFKILRVSLKNKYLIFSLIVLHEFNV